MEATRSKDFQLIVPETAQTAKVKLESDVTVPCHLSPEISAVAMEIRWFKETDCVCLYKNRQMIEGRGYEGRVNLSNEKLERGDVSLSLNDFRLSDVGDYVCQVTSGDTTQEISIRVKQDTPAKQDLRKTFFKFVVAGALAGAILPTAAVGLGATAIGGAAAVGGVAAAGGAAGAVAGGAIVAVAGAAKAAAAGAIAAVGGAIGAAGPVGGAMGGAIGALVAARRGAVAVAGGAGGRAEAAGPAAEEQPLQPAETADHIKITLVKADRIWSELERQDMESSTLLTEASVPVRRRNSMEKNPPNMSGETAPVSVPASELRLVLLGSAGSEKSAAGTIILGREKNQTDTSTEIQQSESRQQEVDGKQVTVVETPDWFCSGLSLEEVRQDVGLCVRLSAPGPHAFLLLIPVQQSTGVEREMLEKMEESFGERCWRNTLILFTVTDKEQEKNIEEFVQSGNQEIQRLVEKCGNRFHCLNIHQSGDGSQVSELLEKIEKMVEENTEKL